MRRHQECCLAAGGSNGGNYPAQYFMDREAKTIRSQMFTSNEFVYAPPKFVNENTIAVVTSMRGTPETCVAAQVAKDLGATTIGLYVQESLLTETCDYNVKYDSIMFIFQFGYMLADTLSYIFKYDAVKYIEFFSVSKNNSAQRTSVKRKLIVKASRKVF